MRRWLSILLIAALVVAAFLYLRSRETAAPVPSGVPVSQALGGIPQAGFERAYSPRPFHFPADHGPHPSFKTEWWYFTGSLQDDRGRRFGYQLTFFRMALAPVAPVAPEPPATSNEKLTSNALASRVPSPSRGEAGWGWGASPQSRWRTHQAYMAHFALTDVNGKRFSFAERFSREALGLAGAGGDPLAVWLEDWSARETHPAPWSMKLTAADGKSSLELDLASVKPVVLNGEKGLSRKGSEPGNASYYYSIPRLATRGTVTLDGERFQVTGSSWLDREWSTSALSGDDVGWDWFSLQLDDGRDLMFYRLRRKDGSTDPFSAGTLVAADGRSKPLGANDVQLSPTGWWKSAASGTRYPAGWRLKLPTEAIDVEVVPRVADQELLTSFKYWEGAVEVKGMGNTKVGGAGYLEMTGYEARTGNQR